LCRGENSTGTSPERRAVGAGLADYAREPPLAYVLVPLFLTPGQRPRGDRQDVHRRQGGQDGGAGVRRQGAGAEPPDGVLLADWPPEAPGVTAGSFLKPPSRRR